MKCCKRIAAGCLAALLTAVTAGCNLNGNKSNISAPVIQTPDDTSFSETQNDVTLENERIRFVLNSKTAHFSVTDKLTGKSVASAAPDELQAASEATNAKMHSELSVVYYSDQSNAFYMYSQTDSVLLENFKVLTDRNRIRVYYSFGENESFVPDIFDEAGFEEILAQFDDDFIIRRLRRYYVYYSPEELSDETAELEKKYPYIKKNAAYIIDENLTDIDRADISDYFAEIGYTAEKYGELLKKLNIGNQNENAEKSPGFTVPVEYELTDSGFTVKVLTDKITERSDQYKLQSIEVLPYFGSSSAEGSFFVADGSGSLLDYNSGHNASVFSCYGEDYSLRTDKISSLSQNMTMPVFGCSEKSGGYFAEITEGDEVAKITVEPKSNSVLLNHAYPTFVMRNIDVTDYSDMDIPTYNLFQKKIAAVVPTVDYCLLSPQNNDYSQMAKIYRERIKERFKKAADKPDASPVVMDFLCAITETKHFLGVPYTKRTVLSTVSEIIDAAEKLKAADVGPIVIRLFGYTDDGYEHKAYNEFSICKKVGTAQELKELQSLCKETGGGLYLDADMYFAYKSGNGFTPSKDSARYLNRLQNVRSDYDIVTRQYNTQTGKRYFISPLCYKNFAESLRASLMKNFEKSDLPGISYGATGLYLGADYNTKRQVDRAEAGGIIDGVLQEAVKSDIPLIFDGGNSYVYPYADYLLNIPTASSHTDGEIVDVPFMQMVLHSLIPYAGAPYNLSDNQAVNKLKALEYGAMPYAAFITGSDDFIRNTDYKTRLRSLGGEERLADFIEFAKESKKISEKINSSLMTDYKIIGNTEIVKYDNGCSIYANFGTSDQKIDGITVKAESYAIKEG